MKIAVIYYGQPRFVNNPNCYNSQKDKIFSQGKVDVYAHLWKAETNNYNSSSWSGMNECPASFDDTITFAKKWKPTFIYEETERLFSNPSLFEKIKEKFPSPHWTESDFNKALAHLYSLEKAISIFEESKESYDWVIVLRTDVCVWDFPLLSTLEKNRFYYSAIFNEEHFADICYITSPEFISGLKAYSYLIEPSYEILQKLTRPCAEQFKKETFIKRHGKVPLRQIPIPVRVVRDNNEIGKKW
jgi:hypothetical protein